MSSKTKRGSSAQRASSTSSTPQVPTSSSSVQSPMTPTRLSRIQEKNTLANLNDRLAVYIDRNQQLEHENQAYTKQITQYEENMSRSITRVKADYENEVMGLRRTVDETAKDKNKLENELAAIKRVFDDLKSKFDKKSKDFQVSQRSLTEAQNGALELQNELSRTRTERDALLADKKEIDAELARLSREIAETRNQLENESLARVEAENLLRNKNEELKFNKQLHEKEVMEIRSRKQIEIQEVDGRLQQEYEAKLLQSLQELRAEYESQLRANKQEMENLYDQQNSDLKAQLKRAQGSLAAKSDEIAVLQLKLDSSSQNTLTFEKRIADLSGRVKELEKKSDEDHARFAKMLDTRDTEIDGLMKEKTTLMADYQDLMDTKVALDNEIATYRKLLECEEDRLRLSPKGGRRETPSGDRRPTPLRALKKRRFEEDTFAESEFVSESSKQGDIEIEEDDFEGKFIKLCNQGDKEVSLSGWTLTRHSGDLETTHKFHRQMKLEPKASVTIWSADANGAVHDLPTNIVMKGQKWFPATETIKTTLFNNNNEQMATRSSKKVQVSHQRRRLGFGTAEDLFHQEGDAAQGDRCVIC